jgi:folate-dependent phosphoribosylglycinamide formyltransferase PurN
MTTGVLLVGTDSDLTRIVYNRLAQRFPGMPAIIEEPLPRRMIVRYRLHKLGLASTASQLLFIALIRPFLRLMAVRRISQICTEQMLDRSPIPQKAVTHVPSVNAPEAIATFSKLDPRVVVVSGTRIISRRVLEAGKRVFINTHTGITPTYRGAHGGYWALFNRDPRRCGVTIHVVDAGIDTGEIVAQEVVQPEDEDNFVTYPYLQTAAALPDLVSAVEQALNGTLATRQAGGQSAVWYHPGFFQYLGGRLRGVK